VTGLLLLGSLAAGTKPSLPLVAVTQRGGRPAIILVTCTGVSSRVSVYHFDVAPGSPGYPDGSEETWAWKGLR
jgi:hypothetical protein